MIHGDVEAGLLEIAAILRQEEPALRPPLLPIEDRLDMRQLGIGRMSGTKANGCGKHDRKRRTLKLMTISVGRVGVEQASALAFRSPRVERRLAAMKRRQKPCAMVRSSVTAQKPRCVERCQVVPFCC